MARGVARTGSGRPVFSELQHNGEPPRSTLAAQLVNHFTDGKKHSRNQDQETFRQLLQEVLDSEDEQHPRTEAIDDDNVVNYKLIYVIFKAGLEPLHSEDPFGKHDEIHKQAIDSLAAIEHTIRRNPEVLFAAPSSQESDPKLEGPLFLWLVPRLLDLTGKSQDRGITDRVIQLLRTSLIYEKKVHSKDRKLGLVLKYLKGCTKGQYIVIVCEIVAKEYSKTLFLASKQQPSFGLGPMACLKQSCLRRRLLQRPARTTCKTGSCKVLWKYAIGTAHK